MHNDHPFLDSSQKKKKREAEEEEEAAPAAAAEEEVPKKKKKKAEGDDDDKVRNRGWGTRSTLILVTHSGGRLACCYSHGMAWIY